MRIPHCVGLVRAAAAGEADGLAEKLEELRQLVTQQQEVLAAQGAELARLRAQRALAEAEPGPALILPPRLRRGRGRGRGVGR